MPAGWRKPTPSLCCAPGATDVSIQGCFSEIRVHRSTLDKRRGMLFAGPLATPCALGRGGVTHDKREGDGASPAAVLRPIRLFYRADRMRRPRSQLPVAVIRPDDGWCDDPGHPRYNQPVSLPFSASHERMWREDGLYDMVVDLDWNRSPAVPGRGSAIFMHVARPGLAPTEGCIALPSPVLRRILAGLGTDTRIVLR
jgi:L,D-peptidoglycan transpeptidase YkuD (ErfK/YbiS/YcfS/YnhG family)